jgi:hypothetical protein
MTALTKAERDAIQWSTLGDRMVEISLSDARALLDTCDALERERDEAIAWGQRFMDECDLHAARAKMLREYAAISFDEDMLRILNSTDDDVRKWEEGQCITSP